MKQISIYLSIILIFFACNKNPADNNSINENLDTTQSFFDTIQFSDTLYVNSSAQGNNSGENWPNAFTSIPSNLNRGTVYFIADGDYGSYAFDEAEEGENFISFRKATVNDHGVENGWTNDLGDGIARFSTLNINTSNFIIDGVEGGGSTKWTNDHGFKISTVWDSSETSGRLVAFGNGVSNIKISHVEVASDSVHQGYGHAFYGFNLDNIEISYTYCHDVFGCFFLFRNCNEILMEQNFFNNNKSTSAFHSEFISDVGSDNITCRYNWINLIQGTAVFAGVNGDPDDPHENWEIYGNLITECTHFIRFYYADNNLNEVRNWKVYNNTIALETIGRGNIQIDSGVNVQVYNNIWYNFKEPNNYLVIDANDVKFNSFYNVDFRLTVPDSSLNSFGSENPFANNYHLSSETGNVGKELEEPYTTDMLGKIRGEDGIWDRGAFEF